MHVLLVLWCLEQGLSCAPSPPPDFIIFLRNLQRAMLFLEFLIDMFSSSFHRVLSLDHQQPIPFIRRINEY